MVGVNVLERVIKVHQYRDTLSIGFKEIICTPVFRHSLNECLYCQDRQVHGRFIRSQKKLHRILIKNVWRKLAVEGAATIAVIQYDFQGFQNSTFTGVVISYKDIYVIVEFKMFIFEFLEIGKLNRFNQHSKSLKLQSNDTP
ncbi:Uncharacterised protein [Klebsiella variicola]|nr:Uncharacterised protein [Klebsiella variicola]